jgi:bifunctional DNA-binding transcriptional regulator/antitoxin component of YhaV-PrlF toxin-antitoxin module
VVPKPLREQLALTPGTPLEIELVDNHLEISAGLEPASVSEGPNGPVVASSGRTITDEDVRRTLEAVRERR